MRRISVASNAIQTIDNKMIHLIINCLNCIRRDRNATNKTGLNLMYDFQFLIQHPFKKKIVYRIYCRILKGKIDFDVMSHFTRV